MKKSKRSDGWEDSPLVSSKSFDAEFSELDEEIIELDDEIIELPANDMEDREESTFDVEILDTDQQLDLKENAGKMDSEEEFLIEDDLLKDLPFFRDQPTEDEPAKITPGVQAEPGAAEPAALPLSDIAEEIPEVPAALEPAAPAVAAEASGLEEPIPPALSQPVETPSEPEPSLEDLVVQLEKRLLETVRALVEERLPEIVRTVLREEIERLQTDGQSEQG